MPAVCQSITEFKRLSVITHTSTYRKLAPAMTTTFWETFPALPTTLKIHLAPSSVQWNHQQRGQELITVTPRPITPSPPPMVLWQPLANNPLSVCRHCFCHARQRWLYWVSWTKKKSVNQKWMRWSNKLSPTLFANLDKCGDLKFRHQQKSAGLFGRRLRFTSLPLCN